MKIYSYPTCFTGKNGLCVHRKCLLELGNGVRQRLGEGGWKGKICRMHKRCVVVVVEVEVRGRLRGCSAAEVGIGCGCGLGRIEKEVTILQELLESFQVVLCN